MKVVVIHGTNSQISRKRFGDIIAGVKKKGWTVSSIFPKENLADQLSTGSLFADEVLLTLEQVGKVNIADFEWFSDSHQNLSGSLLIYHPDVFPQKLKKYLPPDTKYESFDFQKQIFIFLDSIYPGNSKKSIILLQEVTQTEPIELLFSLLAKHVRDMYWYSIDPNGVGYPEWRAKKIISQAKKFGSEKLGEFIKEMSDLDVKSKTGITSLELGLAILIVKRLQ